MLLPHKRETSAPAQPQVIVEYAPGPVVQEASQELERDNSTEAAESSRESTAEPSEPSSPEQSAQESTDSSSSSSSSSPNASPQSSPDPLGGWDTPPPHRVLPTPAPQQNDDDDSEPDPLTLMVNTLSVKPLNDEEHFALPDGDPKTYKQAMKSPLSVCWQECVEEEFNSLLHDYKVFEPIDKSRVSSKAKLLGAKWVFKTKKDQHGNPTKHKARLVALGCHQREGIDYHETFAPVIRFSSI